GHGSFRRHDHLARGQSVPDPDRGGAARDRLVRRTFYTRVDPRRPHGRIDHRRRGPSRTLGRPRARRARRAHHRAHQEHHRHHRQGESRRARNAGTLARQGQAGLRQAAERVTAAGARGSGTLLMPAQKPEVHAKAVEARCVRLNVKAADVASLAPAIEGRSLSRRDNEVLIEVKAAAVNPSDVKAATGLMAYAVFPRTPGRDYAGVVVDGPAGTVGREVFGSSGDLGIRRDGTHATHLAVEAEAIVEKPKAISWEEAAGIGVPFVTAMEGLRRAGMPKPGETVLIMGVTGKVGQAAVQIATWHGARAIGVARKAEPYRGHTNSPVEMIDGSATDVADR